VPIRFHVEIMEFYKFISPTEESTNQRRAIFERIQKIISVSLFTTYPHINIILILFMKSKYINI
jgi:hypothetical protein